MQLSESPLFLRKPTVAEMVYSHLGDKTFGRQTFGRQIFSQMSIWATRNWTFGRQWRLVWATKVNRYI